MTSTFDNSKFGIFNFDNGVTIVDKIETDLAAICIRSDGIMCTHVKVDYEIGLEDAENIYELSIKIGLGKVYPNLFTLEKFAIPSNEVRLFMTSPKRIAVTSADAFIVSSLPQKILANFYLKINKPPIPSKMFYEVEAAIKWLKKFS